MNGSVQFRHLSLCVSDLERSANFYTTQLGFIAIHRGPTEAAFAMSPGGDPVLKLVWNPEAGLAPRIAAGLFHAAVLFSNRAMLGTWLRFAAQHGVDFDGFSDHAVSEAIYLSDPEGNGLEFYADRPRDRWPMSGDQVAMVTEPLDTESLLRAATPGAPNPLAEAQWGHLHLRVTDLDRSESFYREALDLSVTQRDYPGARFLAADGYHHHLGLNTWGGVRQPQPTAARGLIEATFARRRAAAERQLHDPDGIAIRVIPM